VTTEPIETLLEIMEVERFAIEATKDLGPFGPDTDRICYHLHEDFLDDELDQNQDEVFRALIDEGVRIERDALLEFPYEIWERLWPTDEWLEHDVPKIFHVMNRFNHGLYSISYEPKGAAMDLYAAAFRSAWYSSEPAIRPAGCDPEDVSKKSSTVVFSVKLGDAVYAAVKSGKLSAAEAVARMDLVKEEAWLRWPNIAAAVAGRFTAFGPEHHELLDWAIKQVVTSPHGQAD
jgi:hypothetical protein